MVLKPLQRIQVIDSKKKCKAGSLGYFVSQSYAGRYNIWDMCAVFTRFGKKGKPRTELVSIKTPIINYANMKQSDKDIIDIVRFYDGLEPRPNNNSVDGTIIAPIAIEAKDILELSDNEFTAYIMALSLFLYSVTHNMSANRLSYVAPIGRGQLFIDSQYDLGLATPEKLAYYIMFGLRIDTQLNKHRGVRTTFATSYAFQIDTKRKKENILNRLQLSLAMAQVGIKKYNARINEAFTHVSALVDSTLKHYQCHKKELGIIKAAEKDRKDLVGKIPKMDVRHKKAVVGRPPKIAIY